MISSNTRAVLRLRHIFTVASIACAGAAGAANENPDDVSRQLKDTLTVLIASDSAWRENDKTFRAMRDKGVSSDVEIEEYAGFVAGLRRQVLEDCQQFRQLGGEPARHELDCGLEPGESPAQALAIPNATDTQTEQEKLDSLENELRGVEIELDTLLLQNQHALQSRSRPQASGGASGGSPGSDTSTNALKANSRTQGSGSEAEVSRQSRGAGGSGGRIRERGAGATGKDRVAKPGIRDDSPGAIPTGDDDDVVARQLREAAARESDPLLREKLWDEYQKYKSAMK